MTEKTPSPWWKIDIQLEEPFSCAAQPALGNEIDTTEHIPATTLRGALFAALSRSGRASLADAWFGLQGPLFSDAWPSEVDHLPLLPMPLCFVRDKYDRGDFDGAFGVYNTLTRLGPTLPVETFGHRHQWTRLGRRWLLVDDSGAIVESADVKVDTSMHVGLHYARQSVRGSALFSREKLEQDTRFCAWVYDPKQIVKDPPSSVLLGKRRSAGNGAAALTWSHSSPWPWKSVAGSDVALVHLLSPAIVPSVGSGAFQRGLTAEVLRPIFGDKVQISQASSAVGTVGGWSSAWGLPRERAITISPGSCWRLTNVTQRPSENIAFLGLRNHEGFGWLALDPPWLHQAGTAYIYVDRRLQTESPFEKPHPWPGIDLQKPQASGEQDIDTLVLLHRKIASDLSEFNQHHARLQFLAVAANRSSSFDDWWALLNKSASSDNAKGEPGLKPRFEAIWDWEKETDPQRKLELARFALSLLVGLTEKQQS